MAEAEEAAAGRGRRWVAAADEALEEEPVKGVAVGEVVERPSKKSARSREQCMTGKEAAKPAFILEKTGISAGWRSVSWACVTEAGGDQKAGQGRRAYW